jgi:hypothetical protein
MQKTPKNLDVNVGSVTTSKRKEQIRKAQLRYYQKHKDKIKARCRKYRMNNREKVNKYQKNRYKTDINFKLSGCLTRRINKLLKGINKSKSTLKLLGCTIEHLWIHLEKQFQPGMTKENYGLYHIDHIRPCASFDLTIPEEQAKCFHYTNLQPLWAKDNLSKGAKYDG